MKLPDYTALGTGGPDFKTTDSVAVVPNITDVAKSQGAIGEATEKAGIDLKNMMDVADVNQVQSTVLQPKLDALAQGFYSKQGKDAITAFHGDPENGIPSYNNQVTSAINDAANMLDGSARQAIMTAGVAQAKSEMYRASQHVGTQQIAYAKQSNDAALENHLTDFSSNVIADPAKAQDAKTLALSQDAMFQKSIGAPDEVVTMRQNNIQDAFNKAQNAAVQQKLTSLPGVQMVSMLNTAVHGTPIAGAPTTAPTQQGDIVDTVMNHLEGPQLVQNDNGHGPSKYGIVGALNGLTPQQTADLTPDQAKQIYINNYWKPAGIDNLPDNMKMVAFDTAVQFGVGTAKGMIQQANGDPQALLNIRTQAYNNLVQQNPDKYGDSAESWKNRTATLSGMVGQPVDPGQSVENPKLFGVPIDPSTVPKLMELALLSKERDERLQAQSDQNTAKMQQKTMNGYVEGKSDINKLLNDDSLTIAQKEQTLKVYNTFNRNDKNTTDNSQNGYDTIQRTLEPNDSDHPNRIVSQTHLDKLLTRNDASGINVKDYQDAKQALELDPVIKQALAANMKTITYANGNVDGKGQQRAIQSYNQILRAWQQNLGLGDKALSPSDFAAKIGEKDGPPIPPPPSRMQQISNWVASFDKTNATAAPDAVPSFATPDDAAFLKLPSGSKFTVQGETKTRTKK